MNNQRRKVIAEIISQLDELGSIIEQLKNSIDEVRAEEQECLDNIPENLQGTARYETSENAVESLDSAYDILDNFDTEELSTYLNEAMQ